MHKIIGIDKENALSVLVSADTIFYIGSFTDTAHGANITLVSKIIDKYINI